MMRLAISLLLVLSVSAMCFAAEAPGPDCEIDEGPCVKEYGGIRVVFDASPKPVRSMLELTFSVTLEGMVELPPVLVLDLSMPGMKMGRNRAELLMAGKGRYVGAGVIVKCPSGRKLWKATVMHGGKKMAEFTFNVGN